MKRGFTMIELVLVITILGILAISALPSFVNLTGNARMAARDGIVGAVRSGLAVKHAGDLVATPMVETYPTALDASAIAAFPGADCVTCFSVVLNQSVSGGLWKKISDTTYTHGSGTPEGTTCAYTAAKGTFTCP